MRKIREKYWIIKTWALLFLFVLLGITGCGGGPENPIDEISSAMRAVPDFSIVLEDMKEEGNFIKDYFHKYKIVTPEKETRTDWKPVSEDMYQKYYPFLGMTIFQKKDGVGTAEAAPPGYGYVGDSRYGHWRTDSSGHSFWAFYGQYRLLSDLMGGRPIYRDSYDRYRTYQSTGRPYYGDNREFGTNGSYTKKTKPNFYARKMSSVSKSKSSFGSLVSDRIGRSRVSSRGRSGGVGK